MRCLPAWRRVLLAAAHHARCRHAKHQCPGLFPAGEGRATRAASCRPRGRHRSRGSRCACNAAPRAGHPSGRRRTLVPVPAAAWRITPASGVRGRARPKVHRGATLPLSRWPHARPSGSTTRSRVQPVPRLRSVLVKGGDVGKHAPAVVAGTVVVGNELGRGRENGRPTAAGRRRARRIPASTLGAQSRGGRTEEGAVDDIAVSRHPGPPSSTSA